MTTLQLGRENIKLFPYGYGVFRWENQKTPTEVDMLDFVEKIVVRTKPTLNEPLPLEEIVEKVKEKAENSDAPIISVGVSGKNLIFAELLYQLRKNYLNVSVVDGGAIESPAVLKLHMADLPEIGKALYPLHNTYLYIPTPRNNQETFKKVLTYLQKNTSVRPSMFVLSYFLRSHVKNIVDELMMSCNLLVIHSQPHPLLAYKKPAIYIATTLDKELASFLNAREEHLRFLEQNQDIRRTNRLYGLVWLDRNKEPTPIYLDVRKSEYVQERLKYRL